MLHQSHRKSVCAVSLVGALAVTLSACSDPVDHDATTLAATSAGLTPLGDADTAAKTQRPEAPAQLMVSNVRIGSHEGYDRVVFDLVGEGEPGWFIDFTDKPTQQGSGSPVNVDAPYALNVNIDGMAYPFEINEEDPQLGTIKGTGRVTEVVSAGMFEGRAQFFIGLPSESAYTVKFLDDPQRLVIDILN